jgi:hypothetical protein
MTDTRHWLRLLPIVLLAALPACTQQSPTPVSPAVVNAPPAPPPPPMPSDADLGTPSGTMVLDPSPAIAGEDQTGLTGTGVLHYNRRRYHFTYQGVNAVGFASQVSPFNGEVFNLTAPADLAGTYQVVAMSPNKHVAVVRNSKGVAVRLQSLRAITGNLESVTIRMTR